MSPNVPPGPSPIEPASPPPDASRECEDGALMAQVAEGSRDAFAVVYARHAPPIMSFLAHSLGDRSTAEDLCQETFLRAWRAAPRFRTSAPLRPWLFRIARNVSRTEMRRRRLARSGVMRLFARSKASDEGPVADSPTGAASDLAAALSVAVGALSERRRAAFVLVRMEGLSYDDAALLLDVPVGTVKSRASAAEAALRRRLASDRPGGAS